MRGMSGLQSVCDSVEGFLFVAVRTSDKFQTVSVLAESSVDGMGHGIVYTVVIGGHFGAVVIDAGDFERCATGVSGALILDSIDVDHDCSGVKCGIALQCTRVRVHHGGIRVD